jgi:hypothetical protein
MDANDVVDAINEAGEDFRILAEGTDDPEALLDDLDAPWSDYIKSHEPWKRAFVIWFEGTPARIATNFRDQWSATPNPSQGVVERAYVYGELAGGSRGLLPGLTYEPAGEEEVGIELELHPVEGREDLFHTVAADGSPVPEIEFQVWDIGVEQPAIDAHRHFDRGDTVRVLETGEEGEVRSTNGRSLTVTLPEQDDDFPTFRPDELEQVETDESEDEDGEDG